MAESSPHKLTRKDLDALISQHVQTESSSTITHATVLDLLERSKNRAKKVNHTQSAGAISSFLTNGSSVDTLGLAKRLPLFYKQYQLKRSYWPSSIKWFQDILPSVYSVPFLVANTSAGLEDSISSLSLSESDSSIRVPSPKKLRKEVCDQCEQLKESYGKLSDTNLLLKAEIRKLKKEKTELHAHYDTRVVNQREKRRQESISKLKHEKKELEIQLQKSTKRELSLKKNPRPRKKTVTTPKRATNDKHSEDIRKLKDQVNYLDNEKAVLEESLRRCEEDSEVVQVKCGRSYNENVRKCVYNSLVCNVPVRHIGSLMDSYIRLLTGKKLTEVPSKSTCARLAVELSLLSFIQIGDFLETNGHLCLSWDATGLDGCHINEIHVIANVTELMVLDVRQLAGGTAVDYANHVVSVLSEIAYHKAKFEGRQQEEILKIFYDSITATMTDRVNVNSATVRLLQDAMECELLDIKCGVHPLATISTACLSVTAKANEKYDVVGKCFGIKGAGPTVGYAVCKLRLVLMCCSVHVITFLALLVLCTYKLCRLLLVHISISLHFDI